MREKISGPFQRSGKDNITEDAGQRLKRKREELNLRYRDVEEASQQIALRRKNDEFTIVLSRLADIENRGTVPSMYRLYSLCTIYRLDVNEVLEWYGVDLSLMPGDAATIAHDRTHPIGFQPNGHGEVMLPLALDPGIDLTKTTYLSRMIQRWGKLPLMLLNGLDVRSHRYAYVGTEDWTMYPLLQPGALVMIDETKKKVEAGGWQTEFERPIYFVEHRQGYACSWCSIRGNQMILQPHPASEEPVETFTFPDEIDVVGQVTGVAMRLDLGKKRHTRF